MPISLTPSHSTQSPSQTIDLAAVNKAIIDLVANETIDDAAVTALEQLVKAIDLTPYAKTDEVQQAIAAIPLPKEPDLTPYAKAADVQASNLAISSLTSDTEDAIDLVGQRISAEELSRKSVDKTQKTALDEEAIARAAADEAKADKSALKALEDATALIVGKYKEADTALGERITTIDVAKVNKTDPYLNIPTIQAGLDAIVDLTSLNKPHNVHINSNRYRILWDVTAAEDGAWHYVMNVGTKDHYVRFSGMAGLFLRNGTANEAVQSSDLDIKAGESWLIHITDNSGSKFVNCARMGGTIPNLSGFALKSDVPDISGLATKAEIPSALNLTPITDRVTTIENRLVIPAGQDFVRVMGGKNLDGSQIALATLASVDTYSTTVAIPSDGTWRFDVGCIGWDDDLTGNLGVKVELLGTNGTTVLDSDIVGTGGNHSNNVWQILGTATVRASLTAGNYTIRVSDPGANAEGSSIGITSLVAQRTTAAINVVPLNFVAVTPRSITGSITAQAYEEMDWPLRIPLGTGEILTSLTLNNVAAQFNAQTGVFIVPKGVGAVAIAHTVGPKAANPDFTHAGGNTALEIIVPYRAGAILNSIEFNLRDRRSDLYNVRNTRIVMPISVFQEYANNGWDYSRVGADDLMWQGFTLGGVTEKYWLYVYYQAKFQGLRFYFSVNHSSQRDAFGYISDFVGKFV